MSGLRNVATWLDTIITQVETKLGTTDAVFDANYIYASLDENQTYVPPTDQYGVIVPGPQRPDQPMITGGGADTPHMEGELAVIVWTRLYVDQAGRDENWLKDATNGSLAKLRQVMKSLQLFDPTNTNGDYYLTQPMRLSDGGWLIKPRRSPPNWGSIAATWKFTYFADLVS